MIRHISWHSKTIKEKKLIAANVHVCAIIILVLYLYTLLSRTDFHVLRVWLFLILMFLIFHMNKPLPYMFVILVHKIFEDNHTPLRQNVFNLIISDAVIIWCERTSLKHLSHFCGKTTQLCSSLVLSRGFLSSKYIRCR